MRAACRHIYGRTDENYYELVEDIISKHGKMKGNINVELDDDRPF